MLIAQFSATVRKSPCKSPAVIGQGNEENSCRSTLLLALLLCHSAPGSIQPSVFSFFFLAFFFGLFTDVIFPQRNMMYVGRHATHLCK